LQERREPKAARADEQGITIGLRFGHDLPRDVAAHPVIHYHLPAQAAGKPWRDQARRKIYTASGGSANYADGLLGITLAGPSISAAYQ
jgi:hypothetical protein